MVDHPCSTQQGAVSDSVTQAPNAGLLSSHIVPGGHRHSGDPEIVTQTHALKPPKPIEEMGCGHKSQDGNGKAELLDQLLAAAALKRGSPGSCA